MLGVPESVVAVDVETTGLSADDRIVTIAAITLRTSSINERLLDVSALHLICDPGRPSHPRALAVHGYQDDLLAKQEPFSANAAAIANTINGAGMVVAHNAAFDLAFIDRELLAARHPKVRPPSFCTMERFRSLGLGSASLDAACRHIGLGRAGSRHGALEDAWLAMMVFLWEHNIHRRVAFPGGVNSSPSNLRRVAQTRDREEQPLAGSLLDRREPVLRPPPGHALCGPPDDIEPEIDGEEAADIDGLSVGIGYLDAGGQRSERTIRCEAARLDNGVVYLDAWCLLREGRRTFRMDRIEFVADYRTGEVFDRPMEFFREFVPPEWVGSRHRSEARLSQGAIREFSDGVKVLLYLAMEDGALHQAEHGLILDYALECLRGSSEWNAHTPPLVSRWIENQLPSRRAAKLALRRLMSDPARASRIAHRIVDVVVADGVATDEEMKAAWHLVDTMEKLERTGE